MERERDVDVVNQMGEHTNRSIHYSTGVPPSEQRAACRLIFIDRIRTKIAGELMI
jgi:hypothetical protein